MVMDLLADYCFQAEKEEICGLPVSPITEDYVENYPSVIDRFYTRYYYIHPKQSSERYLVLFHSNRVCLIYLAPEHTIIKNGISSVSFDIGNMDRSLNQVSGKGKKGGMALQDDSTLAIVTGKDGHVYKVPSCVRGKLIEVNPRIVKDPNLLASEGEGYFAIILPKPEHCDELKRNLLTEVMYRQVLEDEANKIQIPAAE